VNLVCASGLRAESRCKSTKAHVGMIFDVCVEEGSESPVGAPGRKLKGRMVFQRNNVRDENWNAALFQELGSSPATMEAGKACHATGSRLVILSIGFARKGGPYGQPSQRLGPDQEKGPH